MWGRGYRTARRSADPVWQSFPFGQGFHVSHCGVPEGLLGTDPSAVQALKAVLRRVGTLDNWAQRGAVPPGGVSVYTSLSRSSGACRCCSTTSAGCPPPGGCAGSGSPPRIFWGQCYQVHRIEYPRRYRVQDLWPQCRGAGQFRDPTRA